MKSSRTQYCIKTCSSDDTAELEKLLNTMSEEGWEIYTMHEVEGDSGFNFNCIFARDYEPTNDSPDDELDEIFGYRSQMKKMISAQNEPFEMCVDIQRKIKDKRQRINKIKSLIDETSEHQRHKLNKEMSVCIEELNKLKTELQKVISPEIMLNKIGQDKICIKLSEENIELVDPDLEANLVAQTVKVRQKLTNELGYIIPKIRFEIDETLQANEFSIEVRGIAAFKGFVYPSDLMFFKNDLNTTKNFKEGIKDTDYITGKQVIWLPEEKTRDFWATGLSASEVIARVIEFICIKYVEDIFDYNDINRYIEIVGENNLYLIENIIPDYVSVSELKFILTSLIKERVSVKDILYIFEKINDFADEQTKEDLLAKVRLALGRQISQSAANENNVIQALCLPDETVKYLRSKITQKSEIIRIDNTKVKSAAQHINKLAAKLQPDSDTVVVTVPMDIRQLTNIILSPLIPNLMVIAKEEVSNEFSLELQTVD